MRDLCGVRRSTWNLSGVRRSEWDLCDVGAVRDLCGVRRIVWDLYGVGGRALCELYVVGRGVWDLCRGAGCFISQRCRACGFCVVLREVCGICVVRGGSVRDPCVERG
jgi:hypothetical protein